MVSLKRTYLALAAVLLAGCAADEEPPEREAVPIIAQKVAMLPEQSRVEAIGSARAATSAQIFPETAGQVRRVRFAAGDFVRRGAVLVELDARQERLAVELAQVQVREADQLLGRYRRIEDTGAISESQIEAGETALASARVALRQAQTALADRTIRAPFSGHIGLTEIDVGDRIDPSIPIAQLDQRGTLYVDFPAPETVFNQLSEGAVVTVSPFSEPGRQIEARVIATDSTVSSDQRNFTVRTAVDNSGDRLRPGMSFRVIFSDAGTTRPAVPEEAIVWGGEGAYLWAVRDGKARRIPVTITSRRDGRAFVDAPLTARDTVVVEGVQKVREGQEVRIAKAAPAPAQTGTLVTPTPAPKPAPAASASLTANGR
ncbi:efflux RND transporter periplasmic adaptor subunit [Allopontixanthobacter sediminis]|uniref:Efflux RND transporter periplasmic adaptor subunit n=1 Tax=Allopontixanthobacter sediminis TaxID=1689985 RepID=A0A845B581_9SPHN|nr:efflux RND transporter periplasmic adaptor subunit [Allopontixanthobacter sediminis]MXP45588.1 efflux RND transporter periplasmic adaptor subunit [Allopontixanthobacter sediminis]